MGVFGRNGDNELWYRETASGTFGAWTKLSTSTNVASRPKAVMVGSDLYVFFRSTSNDLRYFKRTAGTWGTEQNLGGVIAGSPAAAVDGDGDLIVSARTAPGSSSSTGCQAAAAGPASARWTASSPASWISSATPATCTCWASNSSGLFWNRVWSATPNSWGAWTSLDGVLNSSPTAAVLGSDLYVFGANPGGILFYRKLSGGTWGAWTTLDGVLSGTPDAAATAGTLLAFGTNPAGSLSGPPNDRRSAFSAWEALDGDPRDGPETVTVGTQTYVFGLNAGRQPLVPPVERSELSERGPTWAVCSAPSDGPAVKQGASVRQSRVAMQPELRSRRRDLWVMSALAALGLTVLLAVSVAHEQATPVTAASLRLQTNRLWKRWRMIRVRPVAFGCFRSRGRAPTAPIARRPALTSTSTLLHSKRRVRWRLNVSVTA